MYLKYVPLLLVLLICCWCPSIELPIIIIRERIDKFFGRFDEFLSLVYKSNTNFNIVLAGDFNFDFCENSNTVEDFMNIIDSLGLCLTINQPIQPGNNGCCGTCLDNIVTSLHNGEYFASMYNTILSDHDANLFCLNNAHVLNNTNTNNNVGYI